MPRITKRERFAEIVTVLTEIEGTEDLVEFAEAEIARLEKRAGKERKPTKTQIANVALKDEIVANLPEEGYTATEVAEKILGQSVQKASSLLRQLVGEGRVTRVEGTGKEKTKFYARV